MRKILAVAVKELRQKDQTLIQQNRLAAMGEQAAGIRRLAGNNPRPLEPGDCTAILRAAWHGDPSLLGEPAAA